MAIPYADSKQSGQTYYLSLLNIYIYIWIYNVSIDKLNVCIYNEAHGKKGNNNVSFMIY